MLNKKRKQILQSRELSSIDLSDDSLEEDSWTVEVDNLQTSVQSLPSSPVVMRSGVRLAGVIQSPGAVSFSQESFTGVSPAGKVTPLFSKLSIKNEIVLDDLGNNDLCSHAKGSLISNELGEELGLFDLESREPLLEVNSYTSSGSSLKKRNYQIPPLRKKRKYENCED